MLLVGAASSPSGFFDLTAGGPAPEYTKNTKTYDIRLQIRIPVHSESHSLPQPAGISNSFQGIKAPDQLLTKMKRKMVVMKGTHGLSWP